MAGPLFPQLDRYIVRQLLVALLASTGGLVALIWLTQSIRFIELVVNRGLSFAVFLQLTGLLIPGFVAVILPITTYVVVQFVYQRLATDREITVMRAAGLSTWALMRPALAVAALAALLGYALNLWVAPAAATAFRQYQFEIRNRVAAFLLQEGVFTTVSDNLTVYVRARDPDGTLHGIMVDDARQKTSHATILAERGQLIQSPNGAPRIILENGSRQEIDRQTGRLNVLTFAENAVDIVQNNRSEEQRFRDASEMSLAELLHPDASTTARDVPKLLAEAHRRLAMPLSGVSYAMIGLVAVLTGGFRRHGGLWRPLLAVLAVVALLALGLAAGNLAARDPAWLPLVWAQALAPGLLAAAWLLRPAPRLRPVRSSGLSPA